MVEIREVLTDKDYEDFMKLAFDVYLENKYWVAPIRKDYLNYIKGVDNDLNNCPHKLLLAIKDEKIVGRIIVFIDEELNEYHKKKMGYISEYESINDFEVAKALLDESVKFLKDNGINLLKGPVGLPGGQDHRGFIIDNFNSIPSIMNTYNMDYYNKLFEEYGFSKYHDCYAYAASKKDLDGKIKKIGRLLPRIMQRYNYRVDVVDAKHNLKRDARDIYKILEESLPKEWEDFKPVSKEEIENIINQIKPFMDQDLIIIARENNTNRPIGFALSLPDYNEILHEIKGKLGFREMVYFFRKRKKIKRIRMFVLFVIPEYQKKAVSSAIYYKCFVNGVRKGYELLEGSTIWDYNKPMINDIEGIGANKEITYRIYKKEI